MSRSDRLQQFVRSRWVRLALAGGLIATSAWAFLPYVNYRIASSAFVNAELVRVAAPIAGQLTLELPRKGDFIDRPAAMPLIEARAPDQRHLLQLQGQHAVARERADLARKQLSEIDATDRELADRTAIHRSGMIARLGYELDEARAEKTGCAAELMSRRDVSSRLEQLVKTGTATPIKSSEALAISEATSARCESAVAKVKRLEIELKSAQDGVFLRDGVNDAPYSQQQRERLQLRRQDIEIRALEESLQTSQVAAQIAEERGRLARVSHSDVSLPARHVVWSVAASPGSSVSEGQTLLDLAACQDRFITVELPERDFERFRTGAPAYVRLVGSDDWTEGQIRQVRGSAARTDDRLLAAQVKRPDANSITVEIGLPNNDLEANRNSFCNIGRLAEVRFQRRSPMAFFASVGQVLNRMVGREPRQVAAQDTGKYTGP
jgi:multidrug resistance efflux pump